MFGIADINKNFNLLGVEEKKETGIKFPFIKLNKKPEVAKAKFKIELGIENKNFNPVLEMLGIDPANCKGEAITIIPMVDTNKYGVIIKGDYGVMQGGKTSSKHTSVLNSNQSVLGKTLDKTIRESFNLDDEEHYFKVLPCEQPEGITMAVIEPISVNEFNKFVEEGVEGFSPIEQTAPEVVEEEVEIGIVE